MVTCCLPPTDRDRQRQIEIDRDRLETDRDRQRKTEINRDRERAQYDLTRFPFTCQTGFSENPKFDDSFTFWSHFGSLKVPQKSLQSRPPRPPKADPIDDLIDDVIADD